MNHNKKEKRVLAAGKIKESASVSIEAAATATGTKKGSVVRVILESALSECSHEDLMDLIYGLKTLKIE